MESKLECSCVRCVGACYSQPGWFAPGEPEKAAEFLGIPFEKFRERLIIEYWCVNGEQQDYSTDGTVYVLQPRKVDHADSNRKVASFFGGFKNGRCTFLDDNEHCTIHPVKPMECRVAFPCQREPVASDRELIKNLWEAAGNPLKVEADA